MYFGKRDIAKLMPRYIRLTFIMDQTKLMENDPYGKQIGKMLDIKNKQKRPQDQKPIFVGLESETSEHQIIFLIF